MSFGLSVGDIISLVSLSTAVFSGFPGNSDSESWIPIITGSSCFLSIFDISFDHSAGPGHFAEADTVPGVEAILRDLPNQNQRTVRVYVEENISKIPTFVSHLQNYTSQAFADEYGRESMREIAGLIAQWRPSGLAKWWELHTYEIAQPAVSHSKLHRMFAGSPILDSNHFSAGLIRSVKRLRLFEDANGNIQAFISCSSLRLAIDFDRIDSISKSSIRKQLPNNQTVSQMLARFCLRIISLQMVYQSVEKDVTTGILLKQLCLLHICHASADTYNLFLCFTQNYSDKRERLFDPRVAVLTSAAMADLTNDMLLYEEFNDKGSNLSEAIDLLLDVLAQSLADHQSLKVLLPLTAELHGICKEMTRMTSAFSTRLEQHLRLFELARNLRESVNVWLLSLLASIFLPLSLASGILSMQTRLADLHFLLYDFFGVIIILGTIVVFILFLLRLYVWAAEKIKTWSSHRLFRKFVKPILNVAIAISVFSWWGLITSSFLVGMVKDVGLGLRILGYGSAIMVGLALLIVLGSTSLFGFLICL